MTAYLMQFSLKVMYLFFQLGVIINFKANHFTIYCKFKATFWLQNSTDNWNMGHKQVIYEWKILLY